MAVKFYGFNQVDKATLLASSSSAQFPVSNIKDPRRTKVWRSTSGSSTLVIDFGQTVEIDYFAMVDNPLNGFGISTMTLELSQTNFWDAPPVSVPITIDQEWGWADHEFATTQKYRFARLVVTSTLEFCELSKLYFGPKTSAGGSDFSYPLTFEQKTNATVAENKYGQKFVDEVNTQKLISGDIKNLYKSELDEILVLMDYISVTRPVFIKFDAVEMFENNNRINGYYYLNKSPQYQYQAGNLWSVKLAFEEGM